MRIWEDSFILANKPNSPILTLGSVVRVMDNMDVGEGDRVLLEDGVEYLVEYVRGFQFVAQDKEPIHSDQVPTCKVLSVGQESKSNIRFRSPSCAFRLPAFLGVFNGKIICAHDPKAFSVEDLQLSAGFNSQGSGVYFGDLIDGKPLIMWHGRPCVLDNGTYVEIPSGKFIGKEE